MKNSVRHTKLPIDQIILLEENPRYISETDLEKLAEDIKNDPTFLQQRPSLINLVDGKHYCYAGTQRIKAQKLLGYTEAFVFIEEDVPSKLQKERMLKDNIHRGQWDKTKLLDLDFDIMDLESFGLDLDEIGLDKDLFEEPEELVQQLKMNPPSIKISFQESKDLQRFQMLLNTWLEENNFENVTYSVSDGEI